MRKLFLVVVLLAAGVLAAVLWFGRDRLSTSHTAANPTEMLPAVGPRVVILRSGDEDHHRFDESAINGARTAARVAAMRKGERAPRYRVDEYFLSGETPDEVAQDISANLPVSEIVLFMISADETRTKLAIEGVSSLKIPIVYLSDGPCKTFPDKRGPSPYIWGAGFAWETLVEPLLISINDRLSAPDKDLSIIFVGIDTPESRAFTKYARNTADDLGFKIIDERFSDSRITDFYTFIRDIFASAPNVLFLNNATHSGALFVQQAGKLSVAKEMTVIGVNSFDAELLPDLGVSAGSAITVGRYSPTIKSKENEEFLAAYRTVLASFAGHGRESAAEEIQEKGDGLNEKSHRESAALANPSETALGAYVSVLMLDAARTKHGRNDNHEWVTALPDLEISGPTGRVFADADNHILHQSLYILEVENGTYKVLDSLGEASHPRREGCIIEPPPPPSDQPSE